MSSSVAGSFSPSVVAYGIGEKDVKHFKDFLRNYYEEKCKQLNNEAQRKSFEEDFFKPLDEIVSNLNKLIKMETAGPEGTFTHAYYAMLQELINKNNLEKICDKLLANVRYKKLLGVVTYAFQLYVKLHACRMRSVWDSLLRDESGNFRQHAVITNFEYGFLRGRSRQRELRNGDASRCRTIIQESTVLIVPGQETENNR